MFWFGAGQGGSIDSNLERWYGQFAQPDGRPSAAVATRETRTSHGLTVTVTRVEGRFAGGGMPGAGTPTTHDGYALLGEVDKFVAVSPARFALTQSAGFGVYVSLRGAPRENVTVAWVGPGSGLLGTVYARTLALGDDGTLTTLLETN